MDHADFIRRLPVPPDFRAPTRLEHEGLVATALTRADLHEDVRGINASIGLIRRTRGGRWPTGPVTEELNFADLVWHEVEFRDASSFAYAVYDAGGGYVGCCYLYPMGRRTELTDEVLRNDVDVSWWVTPDAYARGDYEKLYRGLRRWLGGRFPFEAPYYSNAEIPPD